MKASEILIYIKDRVNLSGLSKLNAHLGKVRKTMGKVVSTAALMGSKVAGSLAQITKGAGLVSGAFIGIGTALAHFSLKASGDIEMLKVQLESVLPSVEAAGDAFKESMKFSIKTPFTPAQIVQTRIALEGVGIKGKEAVESIAEASAALNRDLLDVASAVKSLETEPLRNLGIMLKKNGDQFVFDFKDKMGAAQQVVASGFEEAQKAVLGIFDTKFAGGVEKMAQTFEGLKSTLAGVRQQFFAELGDGFLPQAKQIVQDIIDLLNAGINSGKIKELGEAIGKKVQQVRDFVVEIASGINSFKDLQTVGKATALWIKDKLLEAGNKLGAYLAKKAPEIGDAIGRAVKDAIFKINQDKPDFSRRKELAGQAWDEGYRGFRSHNQRTKELVNQETAKNKAARLDREGDVISARFSGGGFSERGDSLRDYIKYEIEKAEVIEELVSMMGSGLSPEEVAEVARGWELTANEIGVLKDEMGASTEELRDLWDSLAEDFDGATASAEETAIAAEESAEAAKQTAEVTTKSLEASTEAHSSVRSAMEKASADAQLTTQVAKKSVAMSEKQLDLTAQLLATVQQQQDRIQNLEFQVQSLKV